MQCALPCLRDEWGRGGGKVEGMVRREGVGPVIGMLNEKSFFSFQKKF